MEERQQQQQQQQQRVSSKPFIATRHLGQGLIVALQQQEQDIIHLEWWSPPDIEIQQTSAGPASENSEIVRPEKKIKKNRDFY